MCVGALEGYKQRVQEEGSTYRCTRWGGYILGPRDPRPATNIVIIVNGVLFPRMVTIVAAIADAIAFMVVFVVAILRALLSAATWGRFR